MTYDPYGSRACPQCGSTLSWTRDDPEGSPQQWFCEHCEYGWDRLTENARYNARLLVGPMHPKFYG